MGQCVWACVFPVLYCQYLVNGCADFLQTFWKATSGKMCFTDCWKLRSKFSDQRLNCVKCFVATVSREKIVLTLNFSRVTELTISTKICNSHSNRNQGSYDLRVKCTLRSKNLLDSLTLVFYS